MASRWAGGAAPAYLFLCLTLGGSAQGIFANMLLQLIGLVLLAWSAIGGRSDLRQGSERQLYGLILLALGLVALQLVPLAPSVWSRLGGHAPLVAGYDILNLPAPWLPLSVAPYDTLSALLTIIPPIALLTAILRLGVRPLWLVAALLLGLLLGVFLGILQVSSLGANRSPWYLYPETNIGFATGFFANSNHMATLLLISIPFLAATLALARRHNAVVQRQIGATIIVGAAAAFVLLGIVLNRSLAGYCLAPAVVLGSLLILIKPQARAAVWITVGSILLLVSALGLMLFSPIGDNPIRKEASDSVVSRYEMLTTSLEANRAFMPLGSGLGTFPRVYALYEDHAQLNPGRSVNHAHDDYVELALEMGLPGLLLLVLFLTWWLRAVVRVATDAGAGPFARAAAIASATILVHSIVDYPLRTAAISSCFAMCLALLVRWEQVRTAPVQRDLRTTRHVVIG